MPQPHNTISGKRVLAVVLGMSLFITFGVVLIALVTRRTPAAPPTPRRDLPAMQRARS